nr:hypothetical protein ACMD2_23844 [Ipomoea batatas]GMD88122.1 hypothetical protein ACMD2_23844 [Ipomoea batatas]
MYSPVEESMNTRLSDWQSEKYCLANNLKSIRGSTCLNLGKRNGEEIAMEDGPFSIESGSHKHPGIPTKSTSILSFPFFATIRFDRKSPEVRTQQANTSIKKISQMKKLKMVKDISTGPTLYLSSPNRTRQEEASSRLQYLQPLAIRQGKSIVSASTCSNHSSRAHQKKNLSREILPSFHKLIESQKSCHVDMDMDI